MSTHRMRINRQLRSARTSALTTEERRRALRAAESVAAQTADQPLPEAGAARGVTSPTGAGRS